MSNKLQILTPDGFKPFEGVARRTKTNYLIVQLSNGNDIVCSTDHMFISNGVGVLAKDLSFYDRIDSPSGDVFVNDITFHSTEIELYDILGVHDNSLYIVDDVVSHNCDVSFISSGNTVIDPELLQFYKETVVIDPIEKTGFDGNLWRWEYPSASKSYIVVADVARGDGEDYSAAHVLDVETATQVAEYRGKLDTKSFGNFLVSLSTDYNEALLVVENSNIGWSTIQQIIDRGYRNLFYMSSDLQYVDVEHQLTNKLTAVDRNLKPGFTMTSRTRPLIISKLTDYFMDRAVTVRSVRLIDELFTFIYYNGKPEAMRGYNDDLVISLAIALWIRDTALRLRHEGIDLTKRALDGISTSTHDAFYGGNAQEAEDTWKYSYGDFQIDLRQWL